MNWYLEALKKYAVFEGWARRKEYWIFFLGNLIICVILGLMEGFADKSCRSGGSTRIGGR